MNLDSDLAYYNRPDLTLGLSFSFPATDAAGLDTYQCLRDFIISPKALYHFAVCYGQKICDKVSEVLHKTPLNYVDV